ncbi:MAG: bifunctional 2-polyprenyl-6-hydroxyphenol methylase/3-demethylubiquinol 3-O-methyltransferase UbiG [Burkholderiaceae bacterium]|nr:bifunctional 2-polyprenyl-6-hydroxyphenol methylase/3-demethylubiquinol 3-O-methyltransferase UbiG [Burkholderiaceae bacterium]
MTAAKPAAQATADSRSGNFDPAELAKFSALAAKWWDPDSEFRPLHQINPLRLEWIDQLASIAGKSILDVGCGGGILSEAMAAKGAKVLGIDLGEKSLKVAELHRLESGAAVSYRAVAVEAYAAENPAAHDVVTCMEMLEHVPDPESVIRSCAELTRPGGWLFFSTINRNPKSFVFAIIGGEYLLRILPRGTHDYAKFVRPSELGAAARRCGLELVEMNGMTYNPLTKVYRLDARDVSVNYLMAFRKPA